MISGIGIDIVENKRITLKEQFINKILSEKELEQFNTLKSEKRKIEFLAGRWAVKEALFKAHNKSFELNKIEVYFDENDKKLRVYGLDEKYTCFASISHEQSYTVGMVVLTIG